MNSEFDLVGKERVFNLVEPDAKRREEYQQKIIEILGLDFPDDYFARAIILCLLDQRGRMCAGAMIVQKPEFRSLLSIPKPHLESVYSDLELGEDLAEINGVWLLPEIKSPILPLTFWRQLIAFLLTLNKRRYLFTFDHANQQMRKLTSWLPIDILYSGPTQQLAGMKNPSHETIALLHRDSLVCWSNTLNCRAGSAVPSFDQANTTPKLRRYGKVEPVDSRAADLATVVE